MSRSLGKLFEIIMIFALRSALIVSLAICFADLIGLCWTALIKFIDRGMRESFQNMVKYWFSLFYNLTTSEFSLQCNKAETTVFS